MFTDQGYMGQDINHIRINDDLSVSFHFGDDYITGISAPATQPAAIATPWYDLSGRRAGSVALPPSRRGIYVSGGRKRIRY